MFKIVLLFACVAACSAHAVLPLVHTPVVAPVVAAPYGGHSLLGFGAHGLAGYGGHGYFGHGYGHHILKRSPHYAPVGHLGAGHLDGLGHLTPVAAIAPVAVSHQSRLDVHHSPAVVAAPILPVVKPVVAPVIAAPLAYGAGHYGAGNYGAGLYGSGHYGAGLSGIGHYGAGHYGIGHGAGHLGHY